MVGGAGNDTYFVDDGLDRCIENAGEGTDAVFAIVHYTLTANVETLVLQGSANLNGTGNALANSLSATPATTRSTAARRRHAHRQRRQRHLRVQCRRGQRRHRRRLRRQRRSSRRFAAVRRLRPRRHLHQHRRDPLAGELQRRRVARRHHVLRTPRRSTRPILSSSKSAGAGAARVNPSCDRRIRRSRSQTSRWSAGW